MKIAQVKKLTPFERLCYWITERESIRLKREKGEPPPWTDDEVLQQYRFTNVRRIDDRVSQWLLKNWYKPYKDHPNMLVAAALARFFNQPATLEQITDLVFDNRWNGNGIIARIRKYKMTAEGPIFNAAYMVRGNDGPDKIKSVVTHNVYQLIKNKVQVDISSMENTWNRIVPVYGFGSFMAGQIVADLRWGMAGPWRDKHDWAPMGPGSKRGMNRLHGATPNAKLDQERFLVELRVLRDKLVKHLPIMITVPLEMMDFQSTLCELDKFCRVLDGEGKPKQRYAGVGV